MTKSILVAVDLSQADPDEKTLRLAGELARFHGAQLDVVTVVPDLGVGQVSSFFPADYEHKAVQETKDRLAAFCAKVLGDKADAGVRHEVAHGKVYREVLRAAQAAGSDLIVVGSHQPDPLRDYLLGTNAAQIVRHSTCSVYVVR